MTLYFDIYVYRRLTRIFSSFKWTWVKLGSRSCAKYASPVLLKNIFWLLVFYNSTHSESSYLIDMPRLTRVTGWFFNCAKTDIRMISSDKMITYYCIFRRKTMIQLNPPITQPDFNRRMTKLSKSESTFVVFNRNYTFSQIFIVFHLKSRNKLWYLKLFLTQLVCVIYKNWNINVNKRRNS